VSRCWKRRGERRGGGAEEGDWRRNRTVLVDWPAEERAVSRFLSESVVDERRSAVWSAVRSAVWSAVRSAVWRTKRRRGWPCVRGGRNGSPVG
jgi:hypothetical protein